MAGPNQKAALKATPAPQAVRDMDEGETEAAVADQETAKEELDEPVIQKKEPPKKPTAVTAKPSGPELVKVKAGPEKIKNEVHPRQAFVLDKKGQKIKPTDELLATGKYEDDTEFLEYARGRYHEGVGYVNANGVLFPVNFKFPGGHIAHSRAEYGVVLNRCPRCGHRQGVDEAVQGECQNLKAGPEKEPCGHSAFEELDSFALK